MDENDLSFDFADLVRMNINVEHGSNENSESIKSRVRLNTGAQDITSQLLMQNMNQVSNSSPQIESSAENEDSPNDLDILNDSNDSQSGPTVPLES